MGYSRELAAHVLGSNEEILWFGRPEGGIRFRTLDYALVPFAVVMLVFSVVWMAVVFQMTVLEADSLGIGAAVPLFGLLFFAFGLYLAVGRFVVENRIRSRVAYLLTNKRVVVVSDPVGSFCSSIPLAKLEGVSYICRRGGVGTIAFGPTTAQDDMYEAMWPGFHRTFARQFVMVADVRAVYDKILEAVELYGAAD